jgi:alpha-aminoadipate carrier protein LysW
MPIINCPECSEDVFVDAESEQGDTVTCDECGTKLVVVGLDPFELDVADEDSEHVDDDDETNLSYDERAY